MFVNARSQQSLPKECSSAGKLFWQKVGVGWLVGWFVPPLKKEKRIDLHSASYVPAPLPSPLFFLPPPPLLPPPIVFRLKTIVGQYPGSFRLDNPAGCSDYWKKIRSICKKLHNTINFISARQSPAGFCIRHTQLPLVCPVLVLHSKTASRLLLLMYFWVLYTCNRTFGCCCWSLWYSRLITLLSPASLNDEPFIARFEYPPMRCTYSVGRF